MTLTELLALALGWLAIAYVIAAAWRRFCRKQPRGAAPKCACSLCSGKLQVRELLLTNRQLSDVQDGILVVGIGASHVATLGFDYMTSRGVGQVVITITDGGLFEQVVAPAIQRHFTARAQA